MSANKEKKGIIQRLLRKSIAVVLFLLLWEVGPRSGLIDSQFIPPLSKIVSTIWGLASSGELFVHIGASLQRAVNGFLLSVAVALPLGFLLGGWFKTFEELLDPLLQILAQVNPFSVFPIFILFFGIGEVAKVAIIFWVCVWPIMFNTISGVKNIDPLLIRAARAMGTSKLALFWKVVLPGAAPSIFIGVRLGAGSAFFMLVAAEMLGASAGLGWLVLNSQINYQISKLFAAAVTIAVLGIVINKLILLLENRLITWKEHSQA